MSAVTFAVWVLAVGIVWRSMRRELAAVKKSIELVKELRRMHEAWAVDQNTWQERERNWRQTVKRLMCSECFGTGVVINASNGSGIGPCPLCNVSET